MTAAKKTKLTLGPVLFNWAPEKWRDFYFRIADEAPIDSVYVGEVVCSKRTPLYVPHLADVVERLEAAGKEVVHSTLALIMDERELDALKDLAGAEDLFVEANDISACSILAGRPHVIGPFINVYNEGTLAYLARKGATRICLPGELPASSLAHIAREVDAELEVQVFGRLPLAISARCYHARSRGLGKDNCQFVCGDDPDGMELETLDSQPFLAVNGTQTLSHTVCNLIAEAPSLSEMGIGFLRLSPQDTDMVAVARIFRDVLDGRLDSEEAENRLGDLAGDLPFSNGFYHDTIGSAFVAETE